MQCTEMSTAQGCLFDSTTQQQQGVIIHYEYGTNATGGTILVATRYTTADGTPIALTATQTVSAGSCQPVAVDVEWVQLCDDTDDDGSTASVPFLRKYTKTTSSLTGATISEVVEDFELDMETAYVPVGTVGTCGISDTETNDLTLCDSTGTAFIRRISYVNGVQVTIGDFEIDGETAYVPVGAVGACPTCAPKTAQGIVATWG